MLYADDLQIYIQGPLRNIINLLDQVQEGVNAIDMWAKDHHLFLNPTKSKILIFGSPGDVDNLNYGELPQISLGDEMIPFVNSAKNLGLIIDTKLSWEPYINDLTRRVWFTLRQLRRSHSMLSREVRKILVQSLIFPIFDYCCLAVTDLNGGQYRR